MKTIIYVMILLLFAGLAMAEPGDQYATDPCNVTLCLKEYGNTLDTQTVVFNGADKNDSVYTYIMDIAGEKDVPIFSCMVSDVFYGTDSTLVRIKYVFLINTQTCTIDNASAYNEYMLYENEGLTVDGNEGYYHTWWDSSRYVVVNATTNESSWLFIEFVSGDRKTLTTGEEWDLGGGFTLTVQSTNRHCTPDDGSYDAGYDAGYDVGYSEAISNEVIGDVTGDSKVNIGDATLLFNWVSYPNERGITYILR
ncbi:MAG: S-layer protein domain-containing protein [Euryarchaeota archaeon]|nr:S-layer protein domain-containing protein [Euryarchaeota archaeon]